MEEKTIYALGFFDGVHSGHGALLRQCREMAGQHRCLCGAVTFSSHPDALVSGKAPGLINTREDREELMRTHYGVQRIICLPFDRALMTMHYMTFFRMLQARYQGAGFVCGEDFRFGNRGEGSAVLLKAACEEAGLPCAVVPQQKIDGIPVSSSYIRTLLEAGDLAQANRFLGHPHRFTGTVVPGRHLGRSLGFPTANLLLPKALLCPRKGVYACMAYVDGQSFPAVTNVGCRPTVGGGEITVEPWLLDYTGDLYGKRLTLQFHAFLRPEQTFPTLDALKAEIRKNAAQTRDFFQSK